MGATLHLACVAASGMLEFADRLSNDFAGPFARGWVDVGFNRILMSRTFL
jgi:hypothetical protein